MKPKKNDLFAAAGSILFHVVVLLILFFTVLKAVVPEEDGGVMVNFGTIDESTGMFEPEGEPTTEETTEEIQEEPVVPTPPTPTIPTPPTPPTPKQPDKLITQDMEESVALAQKKKEEARRKEELRKQQEERQRQDNERRRQDEARRKEAEAQRKAEAERRRQAEEQRKKEQAIRDRVAGAFGKNNSNQGTSTSGTGNQGSPFGNSDRGANKGVGTGSSFSLSGRSISGGGLPHPAYTVQEEGRIVVNIVVDPAGNVIAADIGKGTNIDNASMRRSAIEAARRARFNSIEGSNNQSGTITYRYSLK